MRALASSCRAWLLRAAVIVTGAACMAPGCNGDVLNDSTFRLWCGQTLCDWRLDAGHVNRVATWHPDDYGVELVDSPTQISQETGEGSDCMEFSAVADVEASSLTKVQVDFNLDGVPDFEAPIAETGWHPTKMLIFGPTYAKRLRVIVKKDGPGRAVLAEIRLQRVQDCAGPRVQMTSEGVGDECDSDNQCASGICCGLVHRVCSQCCQIPLDHACAQGQTCGPADGPPTSPGSTPLLPQLCDPGLRHGKPGDACVDPNDCASGACNGVTYVHASDCPEAGASSCNNDRVRAGKCQ